jgi:hypothetical protein
VVSAHVLPMDLKPAFLPVMAARVLNRSRVERASRSSRVTITTSPALIPASKPAKLRPVGLGSARDFVKHLARPCFRSTANLSGDALAVG